MGFNINKIIFFLFFFFYNIADVNRIEPISLSQLATFNTQNSFKSKIFVQSYQSNTPIDLYVNKKESADRWYAKTKADEKAVAIEKTIHRKSIWRQWPSMKIFFIDK